MLKFDFSRYDHILPELALFLLALYFASVSFTRGINLADPAKAVAAAAASRTGQSATSATAPATLPADAPAQATPSRADVVLEIIHEGEGKHLLLAGVRLAGAPELHDLLTANRQDMASRTVIIRSRNPSEDDKILRELTAILIKQALSFRIEDSGSEP